MDESESEGMRVGGGGGGESILLTPAHLNFLLHVFMMMAVNVVNLVCLY